jgi:C1A family cysteine protease
MMKKYAVLVLLILLSGVLFAETGGIFDALKAQRETDKKSLEDARRQVDELKKQIIAENKKFRVGLTWAIQQEISKITGDDPRPVPVQPKPKPVEPKPTPKPEEPKPIPVKPVPDTPKPVTPDIPKPLTPDPVPVTPVKPVVPPVIVPVSKSGDPSAAAFNWRDINLVTPVKFQSTCGSCWAFASMAVYESVYLISTGKTLDLSEQYVVDCLKTSDGRDPGSCSGGSYAVVFYALTQKGAVEEKDMPYKGRDYPCSYVKNTRYLVTEYNQISGNGIPAVEEIKKALSQYGPIAASVKVTPAFQAYIGGIFDEHAAVKNNMDTNHAIVIVGWDDGKKAYLIKNSWSERWGENGYMWIEYGCNNIGRGACYIVVAK